MTEFEQFCLHIGLITLILLTCVLAVGVLYYLIRAVVAIIEHVKYEREHSCRNCKYGDDESDPGKYPCYRCTRYKFRTDRWRSKEDE